MFPILAQCNRGKKKKSRNLVVSKPTYPTVAGMTGLSKLVSGCQWVPGEQ